MISFLQLPLISRNNYSVVHVDGNEVYFYYCSCKYTHCTHLTLTSEFIQVLLGKHENQALLIVTDQDVLEEVYHILQQNT